MQRYPGAEIKKCELRTENKRSIWSLNVVMPARREVTKVEVDGRTGEILTPPRQTNPR
jgi:uncharacterized membrane protein YkoI